MSKIIFLKNQKHSTILASWMYSCFYFAQQFFTNIIIGCIDFIGVKCLVACIDQGNIGCRSLYKPF